MTRSERIFRLSVLLALGVIVGYVFNHTAYPHTTNVIDIINQIVTFVLIIVTQITLLLAVFANLAE